MAISTGRGFFREGCSASCPRSSLYCGRVVTTSPASIVRRRDIARIARRPRRPILVRFIARRWSEFLSRPQSYRLVLRRGQDDRSQPAC